MRHNKKHYCPYYEEAYTEARAEIVTRFIQKYPQHIHMLSDLVGHKAMDSLKIYSESETRA